MKKQSTKHGYEPSADYRDSQVSAEGIRDQLNQVLSSPDFKASKQVKTIFRHLTEETLSGNESQVNAHSIANEVHHRPLDSSPPVDSIVQIQLHQLRRALKGYYAGEGASEGGPRIEIPEDSFAPLFHVEKK